MFYFRSSGDRQHYWGFLEQPSESYLRSLGAELPGYSCQCAVGFREVAGREREPRNEADVFTRAVVQDVF